MILGSPGDEGDDEFMAMISPVSRSGRSTTEWITIMMEIARHYSSGRVEAKHTHIHTLDTLTQTRTVHLFLFFFFHYARCARTTIVSGPLVPMTL